MWYHQTEFKIHISMAISCFLGFLVPCSSPKIKFNTLSLCRTCWGREGGEQDIQLNYTLCPLHGDKTFWEMYRVWWERDYFFLEGAGESWRCSCWTVFLHWGCHKLLSSTNTTLVFAPSEWVLRPGGLQPDQKSPENKPGRKISLCHKMASKESGNNQSRKIYTKTYSVTGNITHTLLFESV